MRFAISERFVAVSTIPLVELPLNKLHVHPCARVPLIAVVCPAYRGGSTAWPGVISAPLAKIHDGAPPTDSCRPSGNQINDQGLASLLAPPTAGVWLSLQLLYLFGNQITDEGCAALASALRGGALPALKTLDLDGNPASEDASPAGRSQRALCSPLSPRLAGTEVTDQSLLSCTSASYIKFQSALIIQIHRYTVI